MNVNDVAGVLFRVIAAQPQPEKAAEPAKPAGPGAVEQLMADPTAAVSNWTKQAWGLVESYGPRVLGAVILLIVAFMIAGWVRRVVLRVMDRAHIDITLAKFLSNVIRWTIVIFALITSAGTLGADTTGFAAAIAAAGLAVGLALQGNLGNLASGVLIMIFRPFKIGDSVIVAGQTGIVDGIDLFTTNLDTPDNRRIIVPNGQIFGGVIENQTRHERRSVAVSVQVSAAAELERTRGLLEAAARRAVSQTAGAIADPGPAVTLAEISPVTWTVAVWAQTPAFGAVRQALLRELKTAIDREQLAPPAPASNIHIRSLPEGARVG